MKKHVSFFLCAITISIFGADKARFRKSAQLMDKKNILHTIGKKTNNDQMNMDTLLSEAMSWKELHGISHGQAPVNSLRKKIALTCAQALIFELEIKESRFGLNQLDNKVLYYLDCQKNYIESGQLFEITNVTLLEVLYDPQTDIVKKKLDLLHAKTIGELENLHKRITNPDLEDDVEMLKEMEENHRQIIYLHEKFNTNLAE